MEQTSLEELKRTAASGAYRRIPIWREIFFRYRNTRTGTGKTAGGKRPLLFVRKCGGRQAVGTVQLSWVRSCDGADLHEPSGDNYNRPCRAV